MGSAWFLTTIFKTRSKIMRSSKYAAKNSEMICIFKSYSNYCSLNDQYKDEKKSQKLINYFSIQRIYTYI